MLIRDVSSYVYIIETGRVFPVCHRILQGRTLSLSLSIPKHEKGPVSISCRDISRILPKLRSTYLNGRYGPWWAGRQPPRSLLRLQAIFWPCADSWNLHESCFFVQKWKGTNCTMAVYLTRSSSKTEEATLSLSKVFDKAPWLEIGEAIICSSWKMLYGTSASFHLHYRADCFLREPPTTVTNISYCHCRRVLVLGNLFKA